ncbi:hypothetical protein [Massilia sp. Dwa41.01b]|uniref:hypothetical protein n=1 Tax=Massilia sp. Dwa41.01b TaxID=2709302 RepID=UPI001E380E71|nr:hypothetical protein [Massilia sp. Dwa41.01b]
MRGSLLGVIDMARYFGMDAGAGPDARLVSLAPRRASTARCWYRVCMACAAPPP